MVHRGGRRRPAGDGRRGSLRSSRLARAHGGGAGPAARGPRAHGRRGRHRLGAEPGLHHPLPRRHGRRDSALPAPGIRAGWRVERARRRARARSPRRRSVLGPSVDRRGHGGGCPHRRPCVRSRSRAPARSLRTRLHRVGMGRARRRRCGAGVSRAPGQDPRAVVGHRRRRGCAAARRGARRSRRADRRPGSPTRWESSCSSRAGWCASVGFHACASGPSSSVPRAPASSRTRATPSAERFPSTGTRAAATRVLRSTHDDPRSTTPEGPRTPLGRGLAAPLPSSGRGVRLRLARRRQARPWRR